MTRIALFVALASLTAAAAVSCTDDPTIVPGEDTGSDTTTTDTGGTDTGGTDTGATDTGGTCSSGVTCVRTRDCTEGGLADSVCTAGCCVPAADTGVGDDTGEACGDITFQGECDGTVVVWCDDDTLGTQDCAELIPDGTCEWFTDDFGYWCAAQTGDGCLIDYGSGPSPVLCAGEGGACVLTADSAECAVDVDECDPDTFEAICLGDLLAIDCNVNQPIAWDCTAFGGTCADGECIGATEGSDCGADFIVCAEGLVCDGESDTSLGTCIADEGSGEGSGT